MLGRIVKGVGNFFDVFVEKAEDDSLSEFGHEYQEYKDNKEYKDKIIACNSKGVFRKDNIKPLVGDIVEIEINPDNKDEVIGVINKIYDRKNYLLRPPIANLDVLFVVAAVKSPAPAYYFIDKLTVTAVNNNIVPVILINKIDLLDECGDIINSEIYNIYKKSGFKTSKVSAEKMCSDVCDFNEIKDEMRGQICAFAGVSGAGKSSVLNKLFPDLELGTGSLSSKIDRGKHTTRVVELFKTDLGGYVADTPGFSMLDFENYDNISKDNLISGFPDLEKYAQECRYKKCTHTKEDGCEVLRAAAYNKIAHSRHESYAALYEQLKKQRNKEWKN